MPAETAASCFHCGLPAPANIRYPILGEPRVFCCYGCQAVAQTIHAEGLGHFYQFREAASSKADATAEDYTAFDLADVQRDFVFPQGTLQKAHLFLPDIRCAACVWLIEKTLEPLAGVQEVKVNASNQNMSVVFDPSILLLSELLSRLSCIGYPPQPLLAQSQQAQWQHQNKDDLLRLGVAGIGMMQAGMVAVALHAGEIQGIEWQWQQLLRWVSLLLTIPIILYSAKPFFRNALRALSVGQLNMDVPVSLALSLAFLASAYATVSAQGHVYFDSVAMFTFFLLLGRYLEKRARYQNFNARIKRFNTLPMVATRLSGDTRETLSLRQVSVGDTLWVPPGAVVPCDGWLCNGSGEVDEALLTGESSTVLKAPGDFLMAGTTNGSTAITLSVSAVGQETQLAQIERMMDDAQLQRPKLVTLTDRMASKFVAVVLIVACLVGCVWLWVAPQKALWVVISVLVVTCPCALSLATPAALTAAINRLRSLGLLVTGDKALEAIHSVDTVVFDKTGTLTEGCLQLDEVIVLGNFDSNSVVEIAASLERHVAHPIAKAFDSVHCRQLADNVISEVGAGVEGWIKGQVYRFGKPAFAFPAATPDYPGVGLWLLLASDSAPMAWFKLSDRIREGALDTVRRLQQKGLHCLVMSGDRQENVDALLDGVTGVVGYGALLPQDKLTQVAELQRQGRHLLMVGDGINDAPVLAMADTSIAMGSATEFAQNKADCILLKNELSGVLSLFQVGARVRAIIFQNLAWAVGYNLTALPLAALGWIPPWAAALGMSASSLIVVLNALRLSR